MGKGYIKGNENMYFRARKNAALYDERLNSRTGAAEMLGVSASTLADYELGITKSVPVDKVVLMAEMYNCPEFKNRYCKWECPIGKTMPIATDAKSIEGVTLRFVKVFNTDNIEDIVRDLVMITSDGVISNDEKGVLRGVLKKIDQLAEAISEVKLIGEKALKG